MLDVSPFELIFGEETTSHGRRSRLTGEPRWFTSRLVGRDGSLGFDPGTPEQARFQAFLAWCLWGEPTLPGDPGGAANRLVSYSFIQSQGPDYWEIGGRDVDRTSHNIPVQVVGFPDAQRSGPPWPLPGLVLEKLEGRYAFLRHEPTGGLLRAALGDRAKAGRDPAGYWRPAEYTPYRYDRMPDISDEASVLLAGLVPRLIAFGQLSWLNLGRYEIDGLPLSYFTLRPVTAHRWLLCERSREPLPHPLVAGMFSLPGLRPPGCSFEQVEPGLSVVRHLDAELWIAIKGKLLVRPDERWANSRHRSTQLEWANTARGYQPYPGS